MWKVCWRTGRDETAATIKHAVSVSDLWVVAHKLGSLCLLRDKIVLSRRLLKVGVARAISPSLEITDCGFDSCMGVVPCSWLLTLQRLWSRLDVRDGEASFPLLLHADTWVFMLLGYIFQLARFYRLWLRSEARWRQLATIDVFTCHGFKRPDCRSSHAHNMFWKAAASFLLASLYVLDIQVHRRVGPVLDVLVLLIRWLPGNIWLCTLS